MCHSDDSRAPAPPRRGPIREHGSFVLEAGDGNRCAAYGASPADASDVGMVILPDVRGLHPFYTDLTLRFAEAGFETVAFDYFGRTAGVGERDDGFDWQTHVPQVTHEQVRADAGAAVAMLRDAGVKKTFTVGFCFGGGNSWRLAASDLGLSGCIGFYGKPERVMDVVEAIRSPLLLLVAGADQSTPQEEFEALDAALTKSGKAHEMYVYDGAPHSFFDRSFDRWKDACADAWQRILTFTGVN